MAQKTRQATSRAQDFGSGMERLLYVLFGMALIGLFILGTAPRF